MSILIKGMEMPKSCRACMYSRTDIRNVDWCVLTEKDLPCDCPLIPIPPHGRLIDADAFVQHYRASYCGNCGKRQGMKRGKICFVYEIGDAPCRSCDIDDMVYAVDNYTTIIPAEEAKE